MLPSPLHPAIVHFPIVLMLLLPLAVLAGFWALRRGQPVTRAWLLPLGTAAALTLSAWVAVETGEQDEDRAENVVGEQILQSHEEAAERFLLLSGGVLLLMAAGLLRGNAGRTARAVGTAAALGLLIVGYQVGHSGGRIVYGDGTSVGISRVSAGEAAGDGAQSKPGSGSPEREDDD